MHRRLARLLMMTLLPVVVSVASAQEDLDAVSSVRCTVGGDAQQVYFLIDPAPDKAENNAARGLLVVLPGGGGGEAFNPFVKRIARYAAPEGFLVVQLVAPQWRPDPPVVWPTQRLPLAEQRFTTEEFIAAVLDDLRATRRLDEDRLLIMGWSSSGPAVYTMLCKDESPFDGFYISMSVFKPTLLPPLEQARGRRVFIEHSPEDRTCPWRLAEQARDELTDAGAIVHLESYAGGHGWRGAIYPRMRAAFSFLLEPDETPGPEPGAEPAQ